MSVITVLKPQTAVQTAQLPLESFNYPQVVVSADNLGAGETVGIYIGVTPPSGGTNWQALTDTQGNVQQLVGGAPGTAIPSLALLGGPTYGFTKTATAGACGIYVTLGTRYF